MLLCIIVHLWLSPLPFQVLKVYAFCHVSHEKLVQWGWVSSSHFLSAVAIKGPFFHALPCSPCLDFVAQKRVLLLGFFTLAIHHPCWLSLSMDLMGFLYIVATQGFINVLLLLLLLLFDVNTVWNLLLRYRFFIHHIVGYTLSFTLLLIFNCWLNMRYFVHGATQKFPKFLCYSLTTYQNFYLPPSPSK